MNENENNSSMNNNYNIVNIQEYNQNISNNDEDTKPKNEVLMTITTIAVFIISIVARFFSMGWLTCILMWSMIGPIHFITFVIAGLFLSEIKNKKIKDYVYFVVLCVSMLLYSFTFVDFGDTPNAFVLIKGIDINILYEISKINLIINICFIVVSIVRYNKQKNTTNKDINQWTEQIGT